MYKHGKKLQQPIPSLKFSNNIFQEKLSNTQEAARMPTQEEMKLYMNTIRKYRIFGYEK